MDLSNLSDEELSSLHKEVSAKPDLSKMSDEELKALHTATKKDEFSKGTPSIGSVSRGLRQGATFNLSDELTGAIQSEGDKLDPIIAKMGITNPTVAAFLKTMGGFAGANPLVSIPKMVSNKVAGEDATSPEYRKERDIERALDDKARSENPAPGVTEAVGTMLNPLSYLGGGGATAKGAGYLSKIGSGMASGLKTGAGIGGALGLGGSTAEDATGVLADTAKAGGIGALTGGVAGGGMAALSPSNMGEALGNFAERRAPVAVGAGKALATKLGPERYQELGRSILDEGIIGRPGTNATEDLLARAQALKSKGGQGMESVYNKIDEAGLSKFSPEEMIQALKNQEGGFYSSPANKDISHIFDNILEGIRMRGENLPLEQAQALKEEIGKLAQWKNISPSDKAQIARRAYGIINKGIDTEAERASPMLGENTLGQLQTAKREYGTGATLAGTPGQVGTLESKLAGELTSNKSPFGLLDMAAAGAGGAIGGPLGAVKGYALKKGVESLTRPSNQAYIADNISKVLQSAPQMLGKYAPILQQAAQRGAPALAAQSFVLNQQDPQFREKIRQLSGIQPNQ